MNWLARLKTEISPESPATKPTKLLQMDQWAGTVGFVGCPGTSFKNIKTNNTGANDPDSEAVADHASGCWPQSKAMNGQEIATFLERLGRFTNKGANLVDAERLSDKLVIRDRESDDRRLCLECAHLRGTDRWRCGNWQRADLAMQDLALDWVLILQRCSGFCPVGNGRHRHLEPAIKAQW